MVVNELLSNELLWKKLDENISFVQTEQLLDDNKPLLTEKDYPRLYIGLISKFHKKGMDLSAKLTSVSLSEIAQQVAPFFVIHGHKKLLRFCLDFNSDLIQRKYDSEQTLLHLAILHDQDDIVNFLLELGASALVKNSEARSPLDIAQQIAPSLAKIMHYHLKLRKLFSKNDLITKERVDVSGQPLLNRLEVLEKEVVSLKESETALKKENEKLNREIIEIKTTQLKITEQPSFSPLKAQQGILKANEQTIGFTHFPGTLFSINSNNDFSERQDTRKNFNQSEVCELLKQVARANLKEVERLLKNNPALVFARGDIKDLSERTFKNITAFQYAIWAYDIDMAELILKYLGDIHALKQLDEFDNRRDIIDASGIHYDFQELIDKYQKFKEKLRVWPCQQLNEYWNKQIGAAQRKCPAWLVYTICETSNTKETAWSAEDFSLPVERIPIEIDCHLAYWFNSEYKDEAVEGIVRGKGIITRYRGKFVLTTYSELKNSGHTHDQILGVGVTPNSPGFVIDFPNSNDLFRSHSTHDYFSLQSLERQQAELLSKLKIRLKNPQPPTDLAVPKLK